MAVLLGFYHLLLEREKMHRFNRFYLLGAIVFSFTVPFITIPVYAEAAAIPYTRLQAGTTPNMPIGGQAVDNWQYIGGLHALISIAMLLRFIRNIWHITSKIKANTIVTYKNATLILLQEKILPHTFLNYIFINARDYESRDVKDELYLHELAHVTQKHTFDILFIELFKVFFWFNPFTYLYKRAIQLNHEFLADEQVVKSSANVSNYQQLLLEMASAGKNYALASSLTFSITKKRFIMMTKTTSTLKSNFLRASIAPAIACVMLFLCTETVAQETSGKITTAPDRIEVTSVTKKELDSLKNVDPVKYRGKESEFVKTTMTSKTGTTTSFDKRPPTVDEKQFSSLPEIDLDKIKSIEILQLTEMEKSNLKKLDPEKYTDVELKNYMAVKTSYLNDEGKLISHIFYEKKPTF